MSLALDILGTPMANPFMNAAGVLCSTRAELDSLTASASGSLVSKSCTVAPRDGNPEPRYSALPLGSINSMGLPNLGFDFYLDYAASGHDYSRKPLFVSVSGLSVEDNAAMTGRLAAKHNRVASEGRAFFLELNLSCPNVPGKPQIAYDMAAMRAYLTAVSAAYGRPFGVKMPPYFDFAHFDEAAAVLNDFPLVLFITCVNSVGNGLVIDAETETVAIKPKDGFGGLGGRYILPTALANVNAFYRRCGAGRPAHEGRPAEEGEAFKMVFGCGGVYSGEDAFMHILAGAHMVQVGTALHEEGTGIFDRLAAELKAVMDRKGYKTLDEFRGKVKTIA